MQRRRYNFVVLFINYHVTTIVARRGSRHTLRIFLIYTLVVKRQANPRVQIRNPFAELRVYVFIQLTLNTHTYTLDAEIYPR